MHTDAYTRATEILEDASTHRVWSVLASVFGDLAQQPGEGIDGPVLTAMMSQIGIKPEATRVALHRLRNDGWITSAKSGRTSRHSLTDTGRRETVSASAIIYRRPKDTSQGWQLVVLETATAQTRETMEQLGFAPLAPRLYVGSNTATAPRNCLAVPADKAPHWFGAQFEPKDLSQDYAALYERLTTIADLGLRADTLNALQIGVLRCLIVHSWRRLVLRHPDLPPAVYSNAWRGHDCRALVIMLLDALPRPSIEALHR